MNLKYLWLIATSSNEKTDNMQEQMGKASIEMEILRENQKKSWSQKHCNRIKNSSNGLTSTLSTTQGKISVLEDMARVPLLGALIQIMWILKTKPCHLESSRISEYHLHWATSVWALFKIMRCENLKKKTWPVAPLNTSTSVPASQKVRFSPCC